MTNKKIIYLSIIGLFLGFINIKQVLAQELPEDVQKSINQGFEAAESQQWNEALDLFFRAVYSLSAKEIEIPPELIFNFALACDKSQGRSLAAAAWYRAYLAAVPNDDNAIQIQQRADELLEAYDSIIWPRISEMESIIKDVIQNIPSDYKNSFAFKMDMINIQSVVGDIAAIRINMGDLSGVEKFLEIKKEIEAYEFDDGGYRGIIYALAGIGEYEKAKSLLVKIKDESARTDVKSSMELPYQLYLSQHQSTLDCTNPKSMWIGVAITAGIYEAWQNYIPPDSEKFIDKFTQAIEEENEISGIFSKISDFVGYLNRGTSERVPYQEALEAC